jgi:hypothetical protein
MKGSNLKAMDGILEWLCDSRWHRLDEMKVHFSLLGDEIEGIIRFLGEQSFIELDEEAKKAKIKPVGAKFLELPQLRRW